MIISAKTVITGDGKTVISDGAVLIADSMIKELGPSSELKKAHPDEEYVDYGDATILPGLIDMHVHIGYWYNRRDKEQYDEYLIAYMALDFVQRALANGVTTMRDISSPHSVCRQLNLAVKKGFVKAPRVIFCNRALCSTGGHAWETAGSITEVDGEWEIRKAVRTEIREGATWIKVMTSHRTRGVSEFTQEELNAAVDECHRHKCKAAAHSGLQPSLQYCINAGFDTIEHATDLTLEQVRQMAEKGMAWTPTFLVHKNSYLRMKKIVAEGREDSLTEQQKQGFNIYGKSNEAYSKNFKTFADTGITVLAGTDMIGEGAEAAPVADELECMVEYGFDPVRAIASGTSHSARVLGLGEETGLLASGLAADILVVNGDASRNITALKNVREVFLNGSLVRR